MGDGKGENIYYAIPADYDLAVLKDGDLVEVDANQGIVKIIK